MYSYSLSLCVLIIDNNEEAKTQLQHVSPFSDILSPTDEFEFWADTARVGRGESKDRAEHFVELFKPISKDYGGLDAMSLQDAMEIVDITQDTLDDVWRQTEYDPYPENRMGHLMDCIGMQELQAGLYIHEENNTTSMCSFQETCIQKLHLQ